MAEHGRGSKFLFIALPTLAAVLAAAYFFWSRPRFAPIPFSGPTAQHFLGSISFDLPAEFQVTSGRLQLLCQGPPSLTRVREIPHPPLDRTAQLTALVPAEPPPFNLVEAEADFGRPALWAFSQAEPGEVMAQLLLGFQSGAVILSRVFPADRLEGELTAFTDEARGFAEKYAWGHEGAGPGERFSLHGRLRLDQACRCFRGNVKFNAPEAALEVFWPGTEKPEGRPGEPNEPKGHRLLRSEPRLLDGRAGQQRVSLDSGPESAGEAALTAVWRPEAEEEAVIIMFAPAASAARALGYWDAILDSVRFIGPEPAASEEETLEQPASEPDLPEIQEQPAPEPETPEIQEQPVPEPETPEIQEQPAPDPEIPELQEQPAPDPETPEIQEQPALEPEIPEIQEQPAPEHHVEGSGDPAALRDDDDEWTALGLDFLPEEDIPDDR